MSGKSVNRQTKDTINKRMHDIIQAAFQGDDVKVLEALKDNPKCVNDHEEGSGLTALHIAAANGSAFIVECLLKEPFLNARSVDAEGRTAYRVALETGHEQIALAISRRAYPKSFGVTPFPSS